jgi:hypothetical protein
MATVEPMMGTGTCNGATVAGPQQEMLIGIISVTESGGVVLGLHQRGFQVLMACVSFSLPRLLLT